MHIHHRQIISPQSLILLGTPHVPLNDESVASVRRKNRALIFFLVARDEPLCRDHVLTFFCPAHGRVAAQPIRSPFITASEAALPTEHRF